MRRAAALVLMVGAVALALGPFALMAAKRRHKPPPETSEYMGQEYRKIALSECRPGAVAVVNEQAGVEAGWHRWCYYGRRSK